MTDPFADLASFVDLPRITDLALSCDGSRLVATVAAPDDTRAKYVSALWEIPLSGSKECSRLTRSEQGESAPRFLPDGRLLFVSSRPRPDAPEDEAALWELPTSGEPRVVVERPGGVGGPVVARGSGTIVLTGSRLTRSDDADDAERRQLRKDRKLTAILHTGMPIRQWDHELGVDAPRLLRLSAAPDSEPTDLAPDATTELTEASYSISDDGSTVATSWRVRRPHGRSPYTVVTIEMASGQRRVLADEDGHQFVGPAVSPDGRRVAMARERSATFDAPPSDELVVDRIGGGPRVTADLGDVHPNEWAWVDTGTLVVSGDWHGRSAVLLVDADSGAVVRRLAGDAAYSTLRPSPDGRSVYALRSTVAEPDAPVRLDVDRADQDPVRLATPAPVPAVRGRLEEVQVETDGGTVRGWLCLPPEGSGPAPLMQWIHGGPFMSYNSWSWRWSPWVAVARGWAVLLPDPPLSTGYGDGWLERAWPYLARVVWQDVEALLDTVVERPDIDGDRTALLGASFGGFMTNWIAGHTNRFGAVVTHAGLWALDQQHATTDAAHYKAGIFGTLAEHPEWYSENSPHNSVDAITMPMLVIHGNRDYRVPVSEALRLWWDLVSRHDGDPADLPHRFLQFTGENHWVLSPGDAEIWWDAVLGFCAQHVLGEQWTPTPLL